MTNPWPPPPGPCRPTPDFRARPRKTRLNFPENYETMTGVPARRPAGRPPRRDPAANQATIHPPRWAMNRTPTADHPRATSRRPEREAVAVVGFVSRRGAAMGSCGRATPSLGSFRRGPIGTLGSFRRGPVRTLGSFRRRRTRALGSFRSGRTRALGSFRSGRTRALGSFRRTPGDCRRSFRGWHLGRSAAPSWGGGRGVGFVSRQASRGVGFVSPRAGRGGPGGPDGRGVGFVWSGRGGPWVRLVAMRGAGR